MRKIITLTLAGLAFATSAGPSACGDNKPKVDYTGRVVVSGDGRIVVGKNKGEVPPGTYVAKGSARCYFYTVKTYATGSVNSRPGSGKDVEVTITKFDEFFDTSKCGFWRVKK